ncbi:hypothetical protein MRX96_050095 [Rhipicephalus microplus]
MKPAGQRRSDVHGLTGHSLPSHQANSTLSIAPVRMAREPVECGCGRALWKKREKNAGTPGEDAQANLTECQDVACTAHAVECARLGRKV